MIVWFKPFSGPSAQRKLSTARSFNDALGLNATVPSNDIGEETTDT